MIRVPEWAFEAAGQETRGMGQDAAAYQPGLYLTPAQVPATPKFFSAEEIAYLSLDLHPCSVLSLMVVLYSFYNIFCR